MILKERIIRGALSEQINRFLYVEASSEEMPTVQLLPTGCIYYTVILGKPGMFCRGSDCIKLPGNFIGGPITKPGIHIRTRENYIHFGIEFHPWSLHEWLGLELDGAENFFLKPEHEFFSKIQAIVNSDKLKFESTCDQLEQLLKKQPEPEQTNISRAVRKIRDTRGKITVDELATKSEYSKRHFRRVFRKSFGISPKVYSTIVQLNAALSILKKHDHSINLDLAYEGGYYDEPHFVRRFKDLIGCSPAEFLEHPNEFLETYLLRNN